MPGKYDPEVASPGGADWQIEVRVKENSNGKLLYGTGDAKRNGWAQTNLGLYGSSSVGYLAAVVDTTNVSGVLRLDLNRTDFFGKNTKTYPFGMAFRDIL